MIATSTPTTSAETWRIAIRPRTLPAAAAPIMVGTAVAIHEGGFDALAAIAALVVALLLQIAANLANDLYDHQRGADVARLGPTRVTQSGLVTGSQMTRAIALVLTLAGLFGLVLVWKGGWPILLLGLLSMVAALGYTAGPYPFGYYGLGDLFVFLFFGMLGVAGSAYVQTQNLTQLSLLAAIPVGLLATAIIVVNNLRDIETDRAADKRTMAVRIGRSATIVEYRLLLVVSFLVPVFLAASGVTDWWVMLSWIVLPSAAPLWRQIESAKGPALNPVLAATAKLTFLFSLCFAVGIGI